MKDKNIVILFVLFLIVLLLFINIFKVKKSNKNDYLYETNIVSSSVEEELIYAVEQCKEMYQNYNRENFEVYFNIDFISQYFNVGSIQLISDLKNINLDGIKLYDKEGNELEEFFDDIEYERNSYKIEANKTYMLKIYSYNDSYNYYYLFKIDLNGNATIDLKYYTIGENMEEFI